ncbi:hypothetical protein LBMAG56_39470 [Verrucomicrobiota bacterium]|nr:hypothetical protein LBMAG56_39470 [Verrucomicrobiota bacterium]
MQALRLRGNLRVVNSQSNSPAAAPAGRVASLHVHGPRGGDPLVAAPALDLIKNKGVVGDPRYFDRGSRRQVTLIAREQIADHAAALGLPPIAPGVVLSNIETEGIDLRQFIGWEARVGTAVLYFYAPRTPCAKMDAICTGLRALMGDSRQGVLAQVAASGRVVAGDLVQPLRLIAPARPHLP